MKKLLLALAILTVIWSTGNTLQTVAHAECYERSWQDIEESLPDEVELTIPPPYYGTIYPYLDIVIWNGGILNGPHTAWCLDVDADVIVNDTLKAYVILGIPQEIDWLLNNHMDYIGQLSGDGVTPYVPGDIQAAIWLLLNGMPAYQRPDPDGYPDTNPWSKWAWGLPNWGDWTDHDGLNDYGIDAGSDVDNYDKDEYNADLARAMEIVADAQFYGAGFIPGCDDVTGVILIPYYNLTKDIEITAQPLLITVPGPCSCSDCRVTGGGVDEEDSSEDRATFGGQAGANTASQPQPKGEWTHHQQTGPSGSFTFHGGTASAPAGTEIIEIRCSDPGGCKPSGNPPSPTKQLDFDGIGTFRNIGKGKNAPTWEISANATAEPKGKKNFDGTFHYFEVNIDDLGEPGNKNADADCPDIGFGEKGVAGTANCECPDFYRITIYNGVDAADVVWLDENNIDISSLNTADVIYEFYGYIDGGNLQIHNLTGYDLKNMVSLNDLASRWLEGV